MMITCNQSGNHTVYKRDKTKITYKLFNVYFPFGKEVYNENIIYNIKINDSTNYSKNIIFEIKKLLDTFSKMHENIGCKLRYNLHGKDFYEFMSHDKNENDIDTYNIRVYLKRGLQITQHNKMGYLDRNYDLKGKVCDIVLEVGSLWINEKTNLFGLNIYLVDVVVK